MEWLTYSYPLTIRFSDTDAYGIVHHSKYYCFFEEARYAFGASIGAKDRFKGRGKIRFPVVHSSCDYRHPLVYDGKTVTVDLKCRVQAGCRIEFVYAIKKDGVVYAKGCTKHAVTEDGKLCIGAPWFDKEVADIFGKEEK